MNALRVGPTDTFDTGETTVLSLLGRRVGIWRDESGDWQAMGMVCRHQNGDLSQGRRDGDIVTCPRHGWRYDLSTGECLTESWAGLRRYGVEVRDGHLWVTLEPSVSAP